MNTLFKICNTIFKSLASQQLAIVLLSSLAISLAAGTIIESLHGAKAAQQVVYFSLWFVILLLLIGLNVTLVPFTRLPWRKNHVGFLITHLGIILILFGSLLTARTMVDANIALSEGEKTNRIILDEPLLFIQNAEIKSQAIAPIPTKPFIWEGNDPLAIFGQTADLSISLKKYFPHAQPVQSISKQENGEPSIHISLYNNFTQTEGFLSLNNKDAFLNLGPAQISLSTQPITEGPGSSSKGILLFQKEGVEIKIPLEEALQRKIPLKDTGFEVQVLRFLPHAIVEDGKLITKSENPTNPACEILISGNNVEEKHTVFSLFPNFTTLHGKQTNKSGFKVSFTTNASDASKPSNELRIIVNEDKSLSYQIKSKNGISEIQPMILNTEYNTGWMSLQFIIDRYEPSGFLSSSYAQRPIPSGGKRAQPAALFEFRRGNDTKEQWFSHAVKTIVALDNHHYRISQGSLNQPLGFEIELKDFIVEYYQGTNKPAEFKSKVLLKDPEEGLFKEVLISMNEPLIHKGYRIYQSGYQLGKEGKPDISIFTVSKDIGIPLKYAGSIIMVIGIILIFFTKKYSNPKPLFEDTEVGK